MDNTSPLGDCVVCTGTEVVENGVCRNCGAKAGQPTGVFAYVPFTDVPAPVTEDIAPVTQNQIV